MRFPTEVPSRGERAPFVGRPERTDPPLTFTERLGLVSSP